MFMGNLYENDRLTLKSKNTTITENFPSNTKNHHLNFPIRQEIQRKASCACGGCPNCQAKSSNLPVSHPHDESEIEADEIADRVMRMPSDQPVLIKCSRNPCRKPPRRASNPKAKIIPARTAS